ncbi:DUF6922 domain-containing protein [Anaerophaga thermohalophila]|uniref:DUF6922 domain-containing protein n=1 Tax=Anaerophaga thermohalophila TaxID=177400 RepID=UPI000237D3B6|nr:hypothetical protein [Anaerophaga thermohalophila]
MSANKSNKAQIVSQLSDHLFWDINKEKLDIVKSKKTIIQRVLEYGLIKDWKLLQQIYSLQEIEAVATKIRDLDPKTASFISLICNTPVEKFTCYTSKQSMPQHWNF